MNWTVACCLHLLFGRDELHFPPHPQLLPFTLSPSSKDAEFGRTSLFPSKAESTDYWQQTSLLLSLHYLILHFHLHIQVLILEPIYTFLLILVLSKYFNRINITAIQNTKVHFSLYLRHYYYQ